MPTDIKCEWIKNQPNEDWLLAYTSKKPSKHKIRSNKNCSAYTNRFRYESHRTSRLGRLILVFVDINTGEEAVAFFNVDITRQRGDKKGEDHRTGAGGQFFPKKGSKFRKFWLSTVKSEPRRWARVHKELNVKLSGINFTGIVKNKIDRQGNSYRQLTGLMSCK